MNAFSFLSKRIKSFRFSKGARIVCLVGRIWVTVEGDHQDYILEPGEALEAPGGALIVMEDLSETEIGSYYSVSGQLDSRRLRAADDFGEFPVVV